jgi:hypothetical protein
MAGGGAAFADILDEKVGGFAKPGRMPDVPFQRRFIPPHPLLFATPHQQFRVSPYSAVAEASRQRPIRPTRTLTRRQRQALDAFIDRGASLTADFTASELRSAFRMLALTYHPDRHPDISDMERARLTRVLADLNEHHRELLGSFQPAA